MVDDLLCKPRVPLLRLLVVFSVMKLCLSDCYEALPSNFPICSNYTIHGYTCVSSGWCVVDRCAAKCTICADNFVNKVPNYSTGRCVIATAIPTAVPTALPTSVPTAVPTLVPTSVPTANPTAVPTLVPTAIPTIVPTIVPTVIPTVVPSTKSPSYGASSVKKETPIAESRSVTVPSNIALATGALTTSGAQAVALAYTVRRITCLVEAEDDELDLFMHPLGFPVAGSYWAGAVVGGCILCFGVVVFHVGLHFIVKACTGASKGKSVARRLRYPSAVIPPLLICAVNIATCSVLLLKESKLPVIAVSGICISIGIPVVVMWLFKLDSSKCQFIKGTVPKSKLFVYFLGDAAWESTDVNDILYVESNGLVFDAHTEQKWIRGHYFLLEFWMTIPVVLVLLIESCDARAWILFIVNVLQLVMVLNCCIYSSNFLTHLSVATCLTTCVLIVCSLTGFGGELVLTPMLLALTIVRSIYDFVCYILDVFYSVRELKLERNAVDVSNVELGESMQQSLISIDSLENGIHPVPSFAAPLSTATPSLNFLHWEDSRDVTF